MTATPPSRRTPRGGPVMRPIRSGHAVDALTGAATGLAPGALLVGGPLLGGVVGMPGSALRYVLLSAAVLSGLTAAVAARWPRRVVSLSAAAATRCAATACLLTAVAGWWPSVVVFCTAVVVAAVIGAPALPRHRGTTPWYAGALAGLGAAGAVTGALPDRPGTALAVCGCAGAALLIPAAVGGGGRTAAGTGAVRGVTPGTRGLSASVGAGTTAAVFATQDLHVFRWELVGGSLALSTAVAGGTALGFFTVGAAAASRRRAPSPARPPLLLLALGAAVTACAVAASPWQLTLAFAGVLAVAAGCARSLYAGAVHAGWGMVGAAGGAALWESAGRLVTAGDALVLAALWPVAAAVAWTVRQGRWPGAARHVRHDRKASS
ncbi:hypothetical protein [Streptomyces flavidovirens]|uniref:hypothetical protein n=1 Tax=Streptomyces flavidovirens TaxID=67298 RepID=UPI0004030EDA|nr:hypothetical protein [Streptomyces flavidovirens]